MKFLRLLSLIACVFFASCEKNESSPAPTPDPQEPEEPEEEVVYALDKYWADDYDGLFGIHLKDGLMTLADEPLYVSGVNCYNLFVQSLNSTMSTDDLEKTVDVLVEEEVPIVRFSCSPYHSSQMHYYLDTKEAFLANLEKLATLCDQNHILLIPSIFWNTGCLPDYFEEEMADWGDPESQTRKFELSYTEVIVNALKDHKCLAAWEFGNEFNLAADIAIAGYPDIPAASVGDALKSFATLAQSLDSKHSRLIASGHSVMRNAQWHLANQTNWNDDSFAQYVEITGIMTPEPIKGMSEHIYEEARKFSDLGTLDRSAQIKKSMEAAANLGKVFYVGEFTGPTDGNSSELVSEHYTTYYELNVQLSMIWNFALRADVEHSFKSGTREGNIAFGNMRKINKKFRERVAQNDMP